MLIVLKPLKLKLPLLCCFSDKNWLPFFVAEPKMTVERFILQVAELVLSKESFETNIHDYTKVIDLHAKESCVADVERILKKMNENGILPDILTYTVLVHMYSKAGNLGRAKEAFVALTNQGFRPDMRLYSSMVMAYVNAGETSEGESLVRQMEARDMNPSKEIYLSLLRSYAQQGSGTGALRIYNTLLFAGFEPTLESCALLVEANVMDPDKARENFDQMIQNGLRPDDRCTASMIAAYEKKNLLDKALDLLLQLEKDGFEPGVLTYSVLVDWLGKLQLVAEAEQLLGKISQLGEAPPFKVHVSLCDMYSRARNEKKALQALEVVEAKKELLSGKDFERIIDGLLAGGFVQEAKRIHGEMTTRGFVPSEQLKMTFSTYETFGHRKIGRLYQSS